MNPANLISFLANPANLISYLVNPANLISYLVNPARFSIVSFLDKHYSQNVIPFLALLINLSSPHFSLKNTFNKFFNTFLFDILESVLSRLNFMNLKFIVLNEFEPRLISYKTGFN